MINVNSCTAQLTLSCQLKDGKTELVELVTDFSDDGERAKFVLSVYYLLKGGYKALIQASKLISEKSSGTLIINPIHINKINISATIGKDSVTPARLIQIAGECDTRKYIGIDWLNANSRCLTYE